MGDIAMLQRAEDRLGQRVTVGASSDGNGDRSSIRAGLS
jgi:hypothetical protein